jgi:hypothetical protein
MSYPSISIKYMFDVLEPDTAPGSVCDDPASRIPLERLEAQICELAGHLTAATCRFLVLLGDFDARSGWASGPAADPAGVSAETPAAEPVPGDPADPARCHVEDGPAIETQDWMPSLRREYTAS